MSYNLVKAKPVAVPVESPQNKGITRRLGLQGILSMGILSSAGGLGAWRHRSEILDFIPSFTTETKQGYPPAIMFVLDPSVSITQQQGQTHNSQLVQNACKGLNIEYRRYKHDADLFQEESWARVMQSIGREYGAPCLVMIDPNGRGTARDIPMGVEAAVRLLENTYGV